MGLVVGMVFGDICFRLFLFLVLRVCHNGTILREMIFQTRYSVLLVDDIFSLVASFFLFCISGDGISDTRSMYVFNRLV
jgi:hypothetical protein